MTIESVMRKHEEELMQLPNVTGVGISEKNGKEIIVVFVSKKVPESQLKPSDVVPKTCEGYETDVQPEIRVG
jgi:hypothetical protein